MESEQVRDKFIRAYRRVFAVLRPLMALLYPMRCEGRENIPDGPAVVCANHSNYIDPLLIAVAFGRGRYMRFMAKKELRSVPLVGWVLEKIGVCFVDRQNGDAGAVRHTMQYLKDGDKVVIFPEGTRTETDNEVEAKTGAVRIAARLHVPIVPVYIPRRKKVFSRVHLIIGSPYYVDPRDRDYARLSDGVMESIYALRDGETA